MLRMDCLWVVALLLVACDPEKGSIGDETDAMVVDSEEGSGDGSGDSSGDGSDDGGPAGGQVCDPLSDPDGEPCPPTDTAQECEPNAAGDGWSCVPQYAGTSPLYGDECWLEDQPVVACTFDTVCMPTEAVGAASCSGSEGGGCCTQICDLTAGDDCPDADLGQTCVPFYDEPPAGYEHVGVCLVDG